MSLAQSAAQITFTYNHLFIITYHFGLRYAPMKLSYAQLRLPQEQEQFEQLWQIPGIEPLAAAARTISCFDSQRRIHLANSLRITEHMLPRLAYVVKQAYDRLDLDGDYEIYVYHDASLAASVSADESGKRLSIMLTSALIERMNDAELLFVIGHELGHVLFEHTRMPARHLLADNPDLDTSLTLTMLAWARRAELSADRAGLWACQNFDAATSAFIKLACGLSSSQIQLDMSGYLSQLDCLSETPALSEDLFATHPFSPVRVAALNTAWCDDYTQSTNTVQQLLDVLETPVNIEANAAADFLLWGQLAVATADGEFNTAELKVIREHHDREHVAAALGELNQAIKPAGLALERAMYHGDYIRQQNDFNLTVPERCNLMQTLVVTARADHRLDETERVVLAQLCQALDLRASIADNMLAAID